MKNKKLRSLQLPSTFYSENLLVIKGVRFTARHIDIMACIVNGEPYKRISLLLSIGVKTAETHKKEIRLRIREKFQEDIIPFILKSEKSEEIRQHYLRLLTKFEFEKNLKISSASLNKETLSCLIEPETANKEWNENKPSFVNLLIEHLKLVGIKIINVNDIKEHEHASKIFTLYIITKEIQFLPNYEIIDKPKPFVNKVIYLIHDTNIPTISFQKSQNDDYIDFRDPKKYILLFLKLLKEMFSNFNTSDIFSELTSQWELTYNTQEKINFSLKTYTPTNSSIHEQNKPNLQLQKCIQAIKERPIFLHFLNRELQRSVDCSLNAKALRQIFITLLIATDCTFYTSLSFIWEIDFLNKNELLFIKDLLVNNIISTISNYPTVEEFLSEYQALYRYDCVRYPMYFTKHSIKYLIFKPNLLKEQSATHFLNDSLNLWTRGTNLINEKKMLSFDQNITNGLKNITKKILLERNENAITASLFTNHLSKRNLLPISRLLSSLYLEHYMNFIEGDICTGIPPLTYYDYFSLDFPIFDIISIQSILKKIGLYTSNFHDNQIYEIIRGRDSFLHKKLVELIKFILLGIQYISSHLYQLQQNRHSRIFYDRTLKNMLGKIEDKDTFTDNIVEQSVSRLNYVIEVLRKDDLFLKYERMNNTTEYALI